MASALAAIAVRNTERTATARGRAQGRQRDAERDRQQRRQQPHLVVGAGAERQPGVAEDRSDRHRAGDREGDQAQSAERDGNGGEQPGEGGEAQRRGDERRAQRSERPRRVVLDMLETERNVGRRTACMPDDDRVRAERGDCKTGREERRK